MHLSNGYTYMLSISQFLNELASFEEVTLCSLDSPKQFKEYLENIVNIDFNNKLNIEQISNKQYGIKSNRLFFSKNIIKKLKNFNCDNIVFYTRDFKQMKEMLKYKNKFKNVKYIFETHQILSQNLCREGNYKKAKETKNLEEYVYNNVDGIICITKPLSEEIKKNFPKANQTHLILPVGFSEKFLTIESNIGKNYDLIYSGNFSKWKGIDNLICALKDVINSIPNFKAVLIGANKVQYDFYSDMIIENNLENNIDLYYRMDHKDIYNYVKKSKMGILPNTYEGDSLLFTSPLKLYEYLGSGLKVVCSRLPSIESAIPEDILYWAKPDDINSLSNAIIKAYNDTNHNIDSQKEFAKQFTWKERAKKFSDFLRHID